MLFDYNSMAYYLHDAVKCAVIDRFFDVMLFWSTECCLCDVVNVLYLIDDNCFDLAYCFDLMRRIYLLLVDDTMKCYCLFRRGVLKV